MLIAYYPPDEDNLMKTKSFYEPESKELKLLDDKVIAYIFDIQKQISQTEQELGYSLYEGLESYIALLEQEPKTGEKIKPFRTITVEGMNGIMDTSLHLEKLGFICINKNDIYPTQGYDCLFVMK